MRYIPLSVLYEELKDLPDNLCLAKKVTRTNVNSGNSQLILSPQSVLNKKYLTLLRSLNITQICIDDPLTDDIDIDDRIDSEIFDQFQYHYDKLRKSLYPLYLDIKKSTLDQQTFNAKYRMSVHTHVYAQPSFSRLHHIIANMFDSFKHKHRSHSYAHFPHYVSTTNYVHYHAIVCAHIAAKFLMETGEILEKAENIFFGTILQDLGIMPDYYSTETLSKDDFKRFKEHPRLALMIINESAALNPLMGISALHHHKYKNRAGFPKDTKVRKMYDYKEGVHLNGRISCIVNAYAALSLFYNPYKVMDALGQVFTNFLIDPELGPLLEGFVKPYNPGMSVALHSGEKCIIKEISDAGKVVLRIIRDTDGNRLTVKKDTITFLHHGKIQGLWHQDKKLKDRISLEYPSIIQSYLKYN